MATKRMVKGAARPTVSRQELLVDGDDTAFRRFVHDLLAFSVRTEQVRSGFGRVLGLSGTAYTILISIAHLGQTEKDLGISRISEHLHLSGAFVTIEVTKLVAAGLVAKDPNERDRRRVLLSVTQEGLDLLGRLSPTQKSVNDTLFECLDAREFEAMRDLLARLVPCGDRAVALLDYLTKVEADEPARKSAVRLSA